jgi:hypothetical protein
MKQIFDFRFLILDFKMKLCNWQLAVIFSLLLAPCSTLLAQGSIYSHFGIGEIRTSVSAKNIASGELNATMRDKYSFHILFPATWGEISRTIFTTGFLYEGVNSSTISEHVFLSKGTFNGTAIAFPVYAPKKISVGIGIVPFAEMNYRTRFSSLQRGIPYTSERVGNGGLYQFNVGSSYHLFEDFHTGFSFNYTFGTLTKQENFLSSASLVASNKTIVKHHYSGSGISFGLFYTAPQLFQTNSVSFGLNVSSPIALSSFNDSTTEYFDSDDIFDIPTLRQTNTSSNYTTTIPLRWNVGMSSQLNEQWYSGMEFQFQHWSNFAIHSVRQKNYANSYRISAGCEYLPSRENAATYIGRIAYRLGIHFAKNFSIVNNTKIYESGISGGFGFPVSGESRLNVALELIQRGTRDFQLIKENIFRFVISFDGNELMFVRPEKE